MRTNFRRQVIDIQAQAERLLAQKADMAELETFAQYHRELKQYVATHVTDDFISQFVQTMPDLNLDEVREDAGKGFFALLFGGLLGSYTNDQRVMDDALGIVREIRGKYASLAMVLTNFWK